MKRKYTTRKYSCTCGKWVYRKPSTQKPCPNCGNKMELVKVLRNNHQWTTKEDNYVRKNFIKKLSSQIAKEMGMTKCQIRNRIVFLGLKLPKKEVLKRAKESRYKKGQLPWNKGLRGYMGANITSFKQGHAPANTLYNGAITIRKDKDTGTSYKWIRLAKNKWRELHRHIWEKKYGKVPKRFVVRFKDGNTMNVVLSNLELISRGEHLRRNQPADLYTNKRKYMLESDYCICNTLGIKDKKLQDELIKNHPGIINLKRAELKLNMELRNAS